MINSCVDNMIFFNEDKSEKIIFHRRTWLNLIKGILTHYLRFSENYADSIIKNSSLCTGRDLNYYSVVMICHEEVYHWAMILAYGEQYWNVGYNYNLPDDYEIWKYNYSCKYNLKETIIS